MTLPQYPHFCVFLCWVFKSLSECVVWGRLGRNSGTVFLLTIKRIPHNDWDFGYITAKWRIILHWPKLLVNLIQYQNIHVINVQLMFPLCQGVYLITQDTEGQLNHRNAILAYAAVLKQIISFRCNVLIEGPLGECVTEVLSLLLDLVWIWPWKVDG